MEAVSPPQNNTIRTTLYEGGSACTRIVSVTKNRGYYKYHFSIRMFVHVIEQYCIFVFLCFDWFCNFAVFNFL